MSFEITYRTLCTVELLHHFMLDRGLKNYEGLSSKSKEKVLKTYNSTELLSIIPTPDTKNKLSDLRMIFKQLSNGFRLLSLKDSNIEKPMVVPDIGENLCFMVLAKDQSFFPVTNINFEQGKILFYQNYNQPSNNIPNLSAVPNTFDASLASDMATDGNPNTFAYHQGDMLVNDILSPDILYLARRATNEAPGHSDWEQVYPTDQYNHGTHYEVGDVVWFDDAGTVSIYEAIQDNHHKLPSDTSNWTMVSNLPILYSSQNDLLKVKYHQLEYSFSEYGQELHVIISDIRGDTVYETTFKPVETVSTLVIVGDSLQDGWLKVEVKNETDTVILTDEIAFIKQKISGRIAALIQLNIDALESDYQLLNNDDTFRSPTFRIRFKNRKTNWRYYNKAGQTLLETDPNPLVSSGYIRIQIDGKDVPNPGYERILPTVEKIYSDVYLNT